MRLKSQLIAHFKPWSLGAVTVDQGTGVGPVTSRGKEKGKVVTVVMDSSRSRSGVIGLMQEGLGGLILSYAQALGVVEVGSWSVKDIA